MGPAVLPGFNLTGSVVSSTGTVDISSEDDVVFAAMADVTSTSGTVTVLADNAAGNNGGVITMANGALIDGGSGDVNLTADSDVTVGGVITTGNSTVISTSAGIVDGGDSHVDVAAALVTLNGATGVGVAAGLGTDPAIETSATQLAAATTNSNINIVETDDVALLTLSAGTGTVSLTAGGAITDGNTTDVNVTAAKAELNAADGIDTDTTVSSLAASNSTSGNIAIANSGAGLLTIDMVGATTGVVNSGGDTTVTTDGDLTVTQQATATGALALSTSSTTGANITVNGNVSGGTSATITGGTGNDTILVRSTATTVDNLMSPITIDGGGDAGGAGDTLTLDDTGDAGGHGMTAQITVAETTISNLGATAANIITHDEIETLYINTGAGVDYFDLNALGGAAVTDLKYCQCGRRCGR